MCFCNFIIKTKIQLKFVSFQISSALILFSFLSEATSHLIVGWPTSKRGLLDMLKKCNSLIGSPWQIIYRDNSYYLCVLRIEFVIRQHVEIECLLNPAGKNEKQIQKMNWRLDMRFSFQTLWLFTIQARKESSMTYIYCQGCAFFLLLLQ